MLEASNVKSGTTFKKNILKLTVRHQPRVSLLSGCQGQKIKHCHKKLKKDIEIAIKSHKNFYTIDLS